MDDRELLRQYVQDHSAGAMNELVRRHIGMVWAAAMREMRDPHQAQDVTQAVFIVLMRRAAQLSPRVVLPGWLFKVTHYAAANARKQQSRRTRHEQEAARMHSSITAQSNPHEMSTLKEALPLLNDAVASLSTRDRDAVVMKFFQGKAHGEVAVALGITEGNARQRLFRAMGQLRTFFQRRGIDVSEKMLGAALLSGSMDSVPGAITQSVIAVIHGGQASSSLIIAKGAINMMRWTRVRVAAAVAVLTIGLASAVGLALVQTGAQEAQAEAPQAAATSQPSTKTSDLTPKQVVIAAFEAAQRGDAQGLIEHFHGLNAEDVALLEKVAHAIGAAHDLADAIEERFGAEFARQITGAIGMGVNPAEITGSAEMITGDQAVVDIGKSGPGQIPFVKVGGAWKVSVEVLRTMNRQHVAMVDRAYPALLQLTEAVKSGKFKTAQELQQAMGQIMQKANDAPK